MKSNSIADVRNNLTKLVHAAEAGDDIHISRHGKPVAVIISEERYQRVFSEGTGIFAAIIEWRERHGDAEGVSDEEVDSWRDRSTAREFSWD